ncbi:hypothetical protein [Peribacillus frigoritolerans]|uniref:hypothetical protein n=1 Tax=Peribacillus frigoritolerans TaxID=450367 RepID=UPI0024165239|nr:hypothetical protein [Peribacillus frigoritolerans]MDG4848854.1 hypothetical protein [Peribacillus frigoritolerans]
MTKTNKTNKETIGEMANSRMRWAFARIIKNKKDDPVNSEVIFFNVLANAFHVTLNLW